MNEFSLIRHYFATQTTQRSDVTLGIGDDGAIIDIPSGYQLVITTDTLVAGVHFPVNTQPTDIGHKALAVNLSDLAAMGATPAWVTLALTMPSADRLWIGHFCTGLFRLADAHQVALIGGDLTRGPLSITIQAMGLIPTNQALKRSGAKPGDLIYVTGTLGDAGYALNHLNKSIDVSLIERLNKPAPRVEIGKKLRRIATAAIDISDGLCADLSHILAASQVGARVNVDLLPLSKELLKATDRASALSLALGAGDDYELCFTVSADQQENLARLLTNTDCNHSYIGTITAEPGLVLHYDNHSLFQGAIHGYQHF
jgi:thiamine-monophosphate kinase